MKSKFSLVLVGSFLVLFAVSGATSIARADWLIDRSGALTQIESSVLGQSSGMSEQVQLRAKQQVETATDAKMMIQTNNMEQVRSQIESKQGEVMQIKQEVKDKAGKVVRRIDQDFEPGERLKIERPEGKYLELGSDDEGRFEIAHDRYRAKTDLPISIGENNELIITRPDGTEKIVSVLPDSAADNLRERGFNVLGEEVELDDEGETPVYHFQTQQEKRFLGLFRRTYNQETTISAETGEVVETTSTELSPFARFLESLSF